MLYKSSVIEMQVDVSLTRAKKKEERGPGGVYLLAHFRVCLGGAARSKAQTHAPGCTLHCSCVLYLGTAARRPCPWAPGFPLTQHSPIYVSSRGHNSSATTDRPRAHLTAGSQHARLAVY